MELSEQAIDYIEAHLPELMATATKQAYWQTLASGHSVLIAENGKLLRVQPDGTKECIEELELPIKVEKGSRITI
jgi:hypothetical protein